MNVAAILDAPPKDVAAATPGDTPTDATGFGGVLGAACAGVAGDETGAADGDGDAKADADTDAVAELAAAVAAAAAAAVTTGPPTSTGAPAPAASETAPVPGVAAASSEGQTPVQPATVLEEVAATGTGVEVQGAAGEGEPGRRETNGGVVVTGSRALGHGEIAQAKRTGGGGPSAPSSPSPASAPDRPLSATETEEAGTAAGDSSAKDPGTGGDAPATTVGGPPPRREHATHPTSGGERQAALPETRAVEKAVPEASETGPARLAAPAAARTQPPLSGGDGASRGAEVPPPAPPPPAAHGPAVVEAPAPGPVAARDVERFLRLGQLHGVPGQDGGEMRLELAPEGLGQVEVRVVVHADAVQATLTAHHDSARQALEAHRSSLEAALGRANLRLEGFTVGLNQHQEGHERERGDGRGLGPGVAPAVVGAVAQATGPEPAVAASGLSVRA